MDLQTAKNTLNTGLGVLSARDQKFAKSLLKSAHPSEKQEYWIVELAKRVESGGKAKPVEREKHEIGSFVKIHELFAHAKKHIKFPAIVFGPVKLTVAGPKARVPGSINVINTDTKLWYGRVLETGEFELSPRWEGSQSEKDELVEFLTLFAEDPAGVAGQYGRSIERCVFCNKELTDERSKHVGYGPICASHFHLPWGEKELPKLPH
jgi:hypothetical protein